MRRVKEKFHIVKSARTATLHAKDREIPFDTSYLMRTQSFRRSRSLRGIYRSKHIFALHPRNGVCRLEAQEEVSHNSTEMQILHQLLQKRSTGHKAGSKGPSPSSFGRRRPVGNQHHQHLFVARHRQIISAILVLCRGNTGLRAVQAVEAVHAYPPYQDAWYRIQQAQSARQVQKGANCHGRTSTSYSHSTVGESFIVVNLEAW